MRIVHICARYYPYAGGVEIVVKNIAEHAQKLGHEVTVYATDPTISFPKTRTVNGVELRNYPVFAPPNVPYYAPSPKMLIDLTNM